MRVNNSMLDSNDQESSFLLRRVFLMMQLMGMKDKAGGWTRGGQRGEVEIWGVGGSADRLFSSFLQPLPSGRKVSQTPESTVWRNAWRCQWGVGEGGGCL